MTSSMLAPANADPSCRSNESSSGSSASSATHAAAAAAAACFPVPRLPVEVTATGSGSLATAASASHSHHAKATTTTLKQECSSGNSSTTTDTGGLVSPSSSHEYTVHHQPSLRSHVNLLHHNSELSITSSYKVFSKFTLSNLKSRTFGFHSRAGQCSELVTIQMR